MRLLKSILALALVALFIYPLSAQNWLWAKGFANSNCHIDQGGYITLHPNGNIYCTGIYGNNCAIDADSITISAGGNDNSYFTSFNQNGKFLNITNAAASNNPNETYLYFTGKPVADDSGYIYNTLEIIGTGNIDTINVSGFSTSLLSKWTAGDRCLWAKPFISLYNTVFYNGCLYGLGSYNQSTAVIGNFTLHNPANKTLGYLTRLDKQGNCDWVKQATGGNTQFNFVQVSNNQVFACAQTDSCFSYDTINVCQQNSMILGLLIKADTAGLVKWRKVFTSVTKGFQILAMGVDGSSNCYLMGSFDSVFNIGDNHLYKGKNDPYDGFVVKYDSNGNTLWLKQIYLSGASNLSAIFIDLAGYVYITGGLIGNSILGNDTLIPPNGEAGFVARLNPSGNFMGLTYMLDAGGSDVTEDSDGNAYITGVIGTFATFGSITLTGGQFGDFYVAKLSAITDSTTGEMSLSLNDSTLQIYANPSRGLFTVDIPQSALQAAGGVLSIYDNYGNLVKTQTIDLNTNHTEVDLGQVTHGLYNVLLTANGAEYRGRVVIQ